MANYKPLAQNEDELAPLSPFAEESPRPTASRGERIARPLVFALLAVNLLLALVNGVASLSIASSLDVLLPAYDPYKLPQPDQYYGLPEHARNKTKVWRDSEGKLIYPGHEDEEWKKKKRDAFFGDFIKAP